MHSLKVALFLAVNEIKNTKILTTLLIIFIMTLTFLNLIFSRGVLLGLPQGASSGFVNEYSGDILITALDNKQYIENYSTVKELLINSKYVDGFSVRYIYTGSVSFDPNLLREGEVSNKITVPITSIEYFKNADTNELIKKVSNGQFVNPGSLNQVVLGESLLKEYTETDGIGDVLLKNAKVGDVVTLSVGQKQQPFKLVGTLDSKVQNVETRGYISKKALNTFVSQTNLNASEISISVKNISASNFKKLLLSKGVANDAQVKTFSEATPGFISDIKTTFDILGNIIGGIGLFVASLTIFIIIFVNAITKRRQIGILKGIGISKFAIIFSFVLQSVFYSVIGVFISSFIIYYYLVPYFLANPIDFPFASGVLVAEPRAVFIRSVVLVVASVISGYIPARLVVKQHTVDSILGR